MMSSSQIQLTSIVAGLALDSASISPWLDSSMLPAYFGGVSALILSVRTVAGSTRENQGIAGPQAAQPPAIDSGEARRPYLKRVVENLGSWTIFTFKVLQLLGMLALFGVSLFQLVSEHIASGVRITGASPPDARLVHCIFYGYLSILSLLAVFGGEHIRSHAFLHNSWLAALTWGVYMYRDVWPLATLDTMPADFEEGLLLWVKVALLTVPGMLVPLLVPRKYVPLNPKEILAANPEQTASLWSLVTYTYIAPVIWAAFKVPHLPYDMLPPLSDYDHLKNLVGKSFPHLDPRQNPSQRHLALKLMRVFWVEMVNLAAMSITAVLAAFAAPISINRLLIYLESKGVGDPIHPWFWIALLFFGRIFKSFSDQWFDCTNTRVTVRVQAIVTELVFEHALRIRMKAEISDADNDGEERVFASPDTVSRATPENDEETSSPSIPPATSSSSATIAPSSTSSKVKGKERARPEPQTALEPAKAAAAKSGNKNLVGRINSLVSSDLSSLENSPMFVVFMTIESPLQITLCMVFLYQILGWSAWVGFATMLIMLPLPGYVTKIIQGTQREKAKRTDARVQMITEIMNVIRMIKLFGWESRIAKQLGEKREQELVSVRKARLLMLSNTLINYFIPITIMMTTFFAYTVLMKEALTASKVFSAMSVLDMLRTDIMATSYMLPMLTQANVALERIQDFLFNTELIDEFAESDGDAAVILSESVPDAHDDPIGIRHASFTWANDSAALVVTPGGTRKRTFMLHIDEEVTFQRGKISLITGPTGAGKTSFLMALLGEMHYIPSGPDSFVSLPRSGGIAYAAQESWVQNDTIKNNILFGAPYDDARYKKVISQCALDHDLSLFEAGDETEVGEKGITLSGGQKARITLARAVYSNAQIVLLDDILAALDVHTSRWIVNKCLQGDLLRGRTIILVTHNIAIARPIADFVVDIGSDGRIVSQGSLSSALSKDAELLKEIQEEDDQIQKVEQEVDAEKPEDGAVKQSAGKLVVVEELEEGHVGWKAMMLYLGNVAKRPIFFWATFITGYTIRHSVANIQTWYLGSWAAEYEKHPPEEVAVGRYFGGYTLFVISNMALVTFNVFYFIFGSIRATKIVHDKLVASVLGTTLRWLDKTPTARIIARCTEDIQTLDTQYARTVEQLVELSTFLLLKMLAVVIFTPVFIIPAILVAVASALCGDIYMKAQLSVKREMSNAKAPVMSHFGAAIGGITSIRAYGAQEAFKAEAYRRIDRYSRVAITNWDLNRWITVRVDFIGTLFATALAVHLTYIAPLSASNTGFSLAMAAAFSGNILFCVRLFNRFEITGNSLERIQQYLLIEQEPKPTPRGIPPAYWPASGKLEVHNLSARYSPDGPKVLHEISFEVASGERVGIVGRTGSGKSSLTLALLRCILTEGDVRFDWLRTDKVNLDALRSSITIIPQVPELLSGTLRQNLDPFSEYDDAVLNEALRSAGLFNLQDEHDQSRITLDTAIAGGGANLSVGQRQVLALARAIVRQSKLLILDEATSAIDYETDTIIQKSLRTELGKDVTLLTVAHRLQTIMDADKIMVLDGGRIVEFGKPSKLLENENGILRALVDESGDREKLYVMARDAA